MSRLQIVVIAIIAGLNGVDGYDVLAISFASPGISREWGIDRAALGLVLSMELIGMALGSMLLGFIADKAGRRPTLLLCLGVMTTGMLMVTQARSVYSLSVWRIFTGLGIGGMLATVNAVAAEFSSARRRALNVALMAIGYPIGAVIGGSIAARLLKVGDWRTIFLFGATVTASFLPLVWWLVPESIFWLCQRQPAGALANINRSLVRMGRTEVSELPAICAVTSKQLGIGIFSPQQARVTMLVTIAYFFHMTTFYFILKWVPKIVVDMGFSPSSAAHALVWANVGGAAGGALLGLASLRLNLKYLTLFALLMSTIMVVLFGRGRANLTQLSLVLAIAGFFTNAGIVGLYGIFAQVFPTHLRGTGTGFAIGSGRAGAVLAPIVAGVLLNAGFSVESVAVSMAMGSLCAAAALWFLPSQLLQKTAD